MGKIFYDFMNLYFESRLQGFFQPEKNLFFQEISTCLNMSQKQRKQVNLLRWKIPRKIFYQVKKNYGK